IHSRSRSLFRHSTSLLPVYFPVASYLGFFFFFTDTSTTALYTLSLHDALPIYTQRRRREVLAEGIEGPEVLIDRRRQLTGGLVTTLRGQVLPEDRVVDMTTEVERQILRQLVHIGEIARLTSRRQLLQRGVGTLDIGVVVLGVVQLHDLTRDRRRQRTVVVVEIGKCVLSQWESFRRYRLIGIVPDPRTSSGLEVKSVGLERDPPRGGGPASAQDGCPTRGLGC